MTFTFITTHYALRVRIPSSVGQRATAWTYNIHGKNGKKLKIETAMSMLDEIEKECKEGEESGNGCENGKVSTLINGGRCKWSYALQKLKGMYVQRVVEMKDEVERNNAKKLKKREDGRKLTKEEWEAEISGEGEGEGENAERNNNRGSTTNSRRNEKEEHTTSNDNKSNDSTSASHQTRNVNGDEDVVQVDREEVVELPIDTTLLINKLFNK